MKKLWIRIVILVLVFIFGVAGFSFLMDSQNTDNRTDLQTAVIPCMAMEIDGMEVNRMYGYVDKMQVDFMRDSLTPVGTDKLMSVSITPNGRKIESLVYEIRTPDGSKVIENNKIKNFKKEKDGRLTVQFALQKSILMNQEYPLVFTLNTTEGNWNYYTRVIQRASLNADKYIAFVNSFYTKSFVKESKSDLAVYLESDSTADNNSFNDLNIHSSLNMVTWGELEPEISRPGIPSIKDINDTTGSVGITYYITAETESGEVERYQVDEFYRMRYDQTRVRLLDFHRSTKQILTTEQTIASNGRLNLGITDKNVQYVSDSEGKIVAFVQQGDLWSYNMETNKVTRIFSFRDTGSNDERNENVQHNIDIVRVGKNGDVDFVLYGYMNRGQHEGKVGRLVYHYSAEQNVVEEKFFLVSGKSFEFLEKEVKDLSYVNQKGEFYLLQEGNLYQIHMEDKSYVTLEEDITEDCFKISESGRYAAWMEGMEPYNTTSIVLMDLEKGEQQKIEAEAGTKIRLFGFINNDIIYGVANETDIMQNESGTTDFAMRELRIQNPRGELVKNYRQEGYYILDVLPQTNMLEIVRAQKTDGIYVPASSDQIMNNVRDKQDRSFSVIMATIARQANVTGIQFGTGNSQEPLVMEAKFTENTKDTLLDMKLKGREKEEYYAYAQGRLLGIYSDGTEAVRQADEKLGVVMNRMQQYVWERGAVKDKVSMKLDEIPEAVKKAPLNASALKEELQGNGTAVNLTGCTLEQILYEISVHRPVVTRGKDGMPNVIVGFDEYNTLLYDPVTQETFYMGLKDSQRTFEENGNVFICYIENIAE